jgi:biopolymer transport protein ExbD
VDNVPKRINAMAVKLNIQRQAKRFEKMKLLASAGKSRSGEIHINVTALVDMMTVLVIFLVMQFNASGEMLFISKDLKMAGAEHGEQVTRVPILSINNAGDLYFEGSLVASGLTAPRANSDWQIPELAQKLEDNKKRFDTLGSERAAKLAASEDPTSTVNVQVDKSVGYGVLKRVLHTCEAMGYGRIRLAVGNEAKARITLETGSATKI